MKPYSVMVAEDEPLIKENMISKIHNATPCFKVVYAASNGQDALTHMDKYRPDVLITDIQMPVMDGLELIEQAKKRYPDMECIILTGYNEFEYARKAMKNGVQEYLLKPLKQEYSIYLILTAGIVIAFLGMSRLELILETAKTIGSYINVKNVYLGTLLKMVGITYIAEFASGICKDAGFSALGTQVEMFGKLSILAVSAPVLLALLETLQVFVG